MKRTVEHASLRLLRRMTTAHGSMGHRRIAVARIEDGSFIGHGEASTLPGFGLETQDEAEAELAIWAETGAFPATPTAAAAVSCANANLEASRAGLTLAGSLSGRSTSATLRCHAIVGDGEVDASVAAAVEAIEAGHEAVKVKVAAGPEGRDLERIGAIRDAVGSTVAIRLDANGGWDLETAVSILTKLAAADVEFVEEPTGSPEQFSEIASATGHTIALDEHARSAEIIDAISGEGVDVVIAKPAILGGPIATYATALELLDRGLRVIVSSFMDGPVGLDSAIQVAAAIATDEIHGLATATIFEGDFPAHLIPVGGRLVLG